jgi:transcriptional regulator with XRE-family HTH domain
MKELGISRSTPSAWKKGITPTATTLKKIADYFGVTSQYMLSDNSQDFSLETEKTLVTPKKNIKEQSKELLKEIGKRIFAVMGEKKVTQAEMGDFLDISQAAVSAWGNGSDPGCDKIAKIANKLGVSVGYLLTGEAPIPGVGPSGTSPREAAGEIRRLEERIEDLKERIQDYRDRERELLDIIKGEKKKVDVLAEPVFHR